MTMRAFGKPMDVNEELRESKRDSFLEYLLKTTMAPEFHIPCYGRVLSVRNDDYIPNVMKKLSVEGFSSAPAMGTFGYEGFIDLLDMVKYVTNMFWGVDKTSWTDFWDKEVKFQRTTVADVMSNRRFKPHKTSLDPEPVYQDNSTMHALEIMSVGDVKRVAILDNRTNRKLVGIMTQSMLLSELTQRMYMLGELRFMTVREIMDISRPVKSVQVTDVAINAFNMMAQNDISGVAVLDDVGGIVDCLSITDLKNVGVNGEYFSRLFKTVKEFKQLMSETFPTVAPRSHYSTKPIPRRPLYVTPNNVFEDVVRMMADGNIHRVFVCSSESVERGSPRPISVITQTDVLRTIWKHYTYAV